MKSNCNKCIHKEMCKYKDSIKSEDILAKIQTDFPFVTDIDFSCKFFEKKEKAVAQATPTVPVESKVQTKTADVSSEKSSTEKEKSINEFEDIAIEDFGFDEDTTAELKELGAETIRDLKGLASKMTDECKAKVNGRLSAFHRNI